MVNATRSNLLAHDNGVSPLAADECCGSVMVAHTPHQVADGVLHTALTGEDSDHRLRGHSVLH